MNIIEPISQTQLFGLNQYFNDLISLNNNNKLPNKILLSGQKGLGKATMAYHFINYVLSKGEQFEFEILLVSPAFERIVLPFIDNLEKLGINASLRTIDSSQY